MYNNKLTSLRRTYNSPHNKVLNNASHEQLYLVLP